MGIKTFPDLNKSNYAEKGPHQITEVGQLKNKLFSYIS